MGETAIITRHDKPRAAIPGIDERYRLRCVPSIGRLLFHRLAKTERPSRCDSCLGMLRVNLLPIGSRTRRQMFNQSLGSGSTRSGHG